MGTDEAVDDEDDDELFGGEDTDLAEEVAGLELVTITPPAIGILDALEDCGAGAAEDAGVDEVVGVCVDIGAEDSEAAEDCAEDVVELWLVCVLLLVGWAVCVLGGGSVTVVLPPELLPPPPPQAAVNSGAINTITAVVALSRRCQLRLALSWSLSI